MPTHLAVAIVATDTGDALAQARSLPLAVTLVEYRLDMMAAVDVAALTKQTPLPAIFTCRPISQGGRFDGPEADRRMILKQALSTGHLVDVELDALPALAPFIDHPARVIGSHHHFEGMLGDWGDLSERIRASGAGIVKLVGMAASEADVLPPLAWLAHENNPAIGIAMGAAGVATRLLAPRFPAAFLTFASLATVSAPGQIHVREMIDLYGFQRIERADPLLVMLTPDPVPWEQVHRYRRALKRRFSGGDPWLLPLPVTTFHVGLLQALRLARVHGVFRLPEIDTVFDLQSQGLDFRAHAWRLSQTPPASFPDYSDPDALMAFFSQGN